MKHDDDSRFLISFTSKEPVRPLSSPTCGPLLATLSGYTPVPRLLLVFDLSIVRP
jgi:hypothetical protein